MRLKLESNQDGCFLGVKLCRYFLAIVGATLLVIKNYSRILSDKYHRKFSRTNDATQDSEETATASQTSHNSRKKL